MVHRWCHVFKITALKLKPFAAHRSFLLILWVSMLAASSACLKVNQQMVSRQGNLNLESRAIAVIQNNCISCHSSNSANVSLNHRNTQDFISAGLVRPGNPGQSKVFYRLRGSGMETGSEDMPLGRPALSSSDRAIVHRWISEMPIPTPAASDFVTKRLFNRKQIAAVLFEVFGSSASTKSTIEQRVLSNGAAFGGPCDLYAAAHGSSGQYEDPNERCIDGIASLNVPNNGINNTLSSGWLSMACESLVRDFDGFGHALLIAFPTGNVTPPDSANAAKIWKLFYPESTPAPAVTSALLGVATAVGGIGGNVALQYELMVLTACRSDAWILL